MCVFLQGGGARDLFVACAHVACVSSACLYVGLELEDVYFFVFVCVFVRACWLVGGKLSVCVCGGVCVV